MRIADINPSLLNETVEIRGHIVSVWDMTKGRKYIVKDDSGQMPLILWDSVLEQVTNADEIRIGVEVAVSGKVSEYKDELRVVPTSPADIRFLASVDTRQRVPTPLSKLPGIGDGRSVWVTGTVTSMESFSKGVKLHITDNEGSAVVLLWENIYQSLPIQDDLTIDARIGVFGQINHYRDTWEIVPRSRTEIVILSDKGEE